jgi:hypothetical protein
VKPRSLAAVAAGVLVAALVACGGDADPSRESGSARPKLSSPARLRSTYVLAGRARRVDSVVEPVTILDPWRPPLAVAPAGRRWIGVTVRYVDRGEDPFPRAWARFEAAGSGGAVYPGAVRSPPHRLYAGRDQRGNPLFQTIGFAVPRGKRLATLHMTSIVQLWPFDVSWRLRSAGRVATGA